MRSIKEQLMQKIEQTIPDGFLFGFERSEYLTNVQSMHGGLARGSLNNYFDACCVGNKVWFEEFLPRTIQLCQTSVELKVDGGWTPQDASWIYEAYAGATWAYTGQDDVDIWKTCLEYTNLWVFKNKNPTDFSVSKGMTRGLFYTYLQRCLFSEQYQLGIDVYEHYYGKKTITLSPKTGLLTLMYAILRHYQYGEFNKKSLNRRCRQIIGKELKYVYSKGRPDDVVYWLQVMCGLRDEDYTPEEVVLTFYEFLEDDEIPDEIKVLLKEKGMLTRTDLINQKLI